MVESYINDAKWCQILNSEFESDYFKQLNNFVESERANGVIYPPKDLVYNAFNKTAFDNIKIVILGQDPYHGEGQAHGLSFSVPEGVKIPPSLRNIYKELNSDVGIDIPQHGNLKRWAEQGVLLLNATLTVRANSAGSHQKKGWETFTDNTIKAISDNSDYVVFMLWGNYAQKKEALIDDQKHLILKSVHPSPLSARRGFMGCKHFSQANKYLSDKGKEVINWSL
ncbi:MAG: uracil-DNA glycosylase [Bacteroidales bacterium]|jgi:uracil-DNA glycosylase|nr:uracil-DNA glycosylase [Bacteroidales bacterium]